MVENETLFNGLYLSNLIGRIVTSEKLCDAPENINWDFVYKLALEHNVSSLLYQAVKDFSFDEKIKSELSEEYKKAVVRDAKQDYMFKNACSVLKSKNIDFLPLKGIAIKGYYPCSFMRTSVDTDILIKENDRENIAQALQELGLTLIDRGKVHDVYHKEPIYNYEVHIKLFSDDFEYSNYFFDFWSKAVYNEKDGFYVINDNDMFIYLFVHLYKHYVSGGCGIKLFLDIFLLNKKLNLDNMYISNELKKMNLLDFYKTVLNINDILFCSAPCSAKYETLCLYVLKSGNFGTKEAFSISQIGNEHYHSNKIKFFLKSWFLDLQTMKQFYPVLNKAPFLLPFCWIHKGVKALLFRRTAVNNEIKKIKTFNKKNVNRLEDIKKLSGIK